MMILIIKGKLFLALEQFPSFQFQFMKKTKSILRFWKKVSECFYRDILNNLKWN